MYIVAHKSHGISIVVEVYVYSTSKFANWYPRIDVSFDCWFRRLKLIFMKKSQKGCAASFKINQYFQLLQVLNSSWLKIKSCTYNKLKIRFIFQLERYSIRIGSWLPKSTNFIFYEQMSTKVILPNLTFVHTHTFLSAWNVYPDVLNVRSETKSDWTIIHNLV